MVGCLVGDSGLRRDFQESEERDSFVGAMSYRIQVDPEAAALLRTLRPHVVARLGRELADLAAILEDGGDLDSDELLVDDCRVQLVVNHGQRLLEVVGVDQRIAPVAAYAVADAAAAS